jgi:hypothetical protein
MPLANEDRELCYGMLQTQSRARLNREQDELGVCGRVAGRVGEADGRFILAGRLFQIRTLCFFLAEIFLGFTEH